MDELEEVPYRDIDLNELSIQALIRSDKSAIFISPSPSKSYTNGAACPVVTSIGLPLASMRTGSANIYGAEVITMVANNIISS